MCDENRFYKYDWEVLLDIKCILKEHKEINVLCTRVYINDIDLVNKGDDDRFEDTNERFKNLSINEKNCCRLATEFSNLDYSQNLFKNGKVFYKKKKTEKIKDLLTIKNLFDNVEIEKYTSYYSTTYGRCKSKKQAKFNKSTLNGYFFKDDRILDETFDNELSSDSRSASLSPCFETTTLKSTTCDEENQILNKNFDFSFDPERDINLIATNAVKRIQKDKQLKKYWFQRYRLFDKLDHGILMDREGWFSVTPQRLAEHIADRLVPKKGTVVVDAFTGVGGNAIQFARRGAYVYAIDLDPIKIRCAIQNAKIYGVKDQITFICANFFDFVKSLKSHQTTDCENEIKNLYGIDAVFLSPPWGGPNYLIKKDFDLEQDMAINGFKIFESASKISPNICYFLPRNTNIDQLIMLSKGRVETEQNVINGKIKSICAYYENLVES